MQRAALFRGGDAQMAAGDLGELLVPYMPTIRVPKSGDRVYKTECAFSYDSPVSAANHPRLPPRPRPPRLLPLPAAAPRTLPGPLPPPQASESPRSLPPPAAAPSPSRCSPTAARGRGAPRTSLVRGSAVPSCACLFVFFPPSRRSEVVAWTRRFCGFGGTSLLALVVGVCPFEPAPCFCFRTEVVKRDGNGLLVGLFWRADVNYFAFLLPRCSFYSKSSEKAPKG